MDTDSGVAVNATLSVIRNLGVNDQTNLNNVIVGGNVSMKSSLTVVGSCVVGDGAASESALQVCNYRKLLPTQYGVHMGRDWNESPGSDNCGRNICANTNAGVSHLDFSYVGNTNYYNGQITYDNNANTAILYQSS